MATFYALSSPHPHTHFLIGERNCLFWETTEGFQGKRLILFNLMVTGENNSGISVYLASWQEYLLSLFQSHYLTAFIS